jgi:hypothetical protein
MRRRSTFPGYSTFWNWESYFKTEITGEPNLSQLDLVTLNELCHYISIIGGSALRMKTNYDQKKEWQVHALLLEFVGGLRLVPGSSWGLSVYQCFTPRLRYLI